jgi:deazaflavin-dependent oxidoreductase (nitroreductase family)
MTIKGDYEPSALGWVRDQVAEYEASGGARANTLRDTGIPIVVVTMHGHTSGKVRKIGLMRVEHDGEYALIGSYGGRPANPVWVNNLLADPHVMIQDGPEPHAYDVREVFGEERDEWFQRGVSVFPTYADYQAKTERVIPVFIASPAD